VKSKKAEITNYYIEQSWSVSLKNTGRQNFVHNSHRTQSNPIQSKPIQSMDESNPWTSLVQILNEWLAKEVATIACSEPFVFTTDQ